MDSEKDAENDRITEHAPTLNTFDELALRELLSEKDLDPVTRTAAKRRLAMLSGD